MLRESPSPAPFLALADHFADAVEPAHFPAGVLRFRNRRWANAVGLGELDDAQWLSHFSRFDPLPGNLPRPLAMRYHGHQFGTYNPQLGDGRGFLYAQVRDRSGRLLDLGTKGSGQTPWSRQGDGRLTLKGGVREILAATYLETLGVHTSKAFSLVETGEQLHRNDEPSPTRGARKAISASARSSVAPTWTTPRASPASSIIVSPSSIPVPTRPAWLQRP